MPIITSLDDQDRVWLVLQPQYESGHPLHIIEPVDLWLVPEPLHKRRPGPRLMAALLPTAVTPEMVRAACISPDEAARYEVKSMSATLTLVQHRQIVEFDEQGRTRTIFVYGDTPSAIFSPLLERVFAPPAWPLNILPRTYPTILDGKLSRLLRTARHKLISWLYPVEGVHPDSPMCWLLDLSIACRAVFGSDAQLPEERVIKALERYADEYGMDEEPEEEAQETLRARAIRLGVEETVEGLPKHDGELPPLAQPWSYEEMEANPLTTADGKVWRVIDLLHPTAAHMSWTLLVEQDSEYRPQALVTFEQWWYARGHEWRLSSVPLMDEASRAIRMEHIESEERAAYFFEWTRTGLVKTTYKRDGRAWRVAEILSERHFKLVNKTPPAPSADTARALARLLQQKQAQPPAPAPPAPPPPVTPPAPAPPAPPTPQVDLVELIEQKQMTNAVELLKSQDKERMDRIRAKLLSTSGAPAVTPSRLPQQGATGQTNQRELMRKLTKLHAPPAPSKKT